MREIFVSKSVQPMLNPEKSQMPEKALYPVVASLNRFVEGGRMNVSVPSCGGDRGDLKGLKGYDQKLYSMRFSDAAPQYRLLGVFPAKDVFVGVDLVDRNVIDGAWNDRCLRVLKQLNAWGSKRPEFLTYDDLDLVLSKWAYAK